MAAAAGLNGGRGMLRQRPADELEPATWLLDEQGTATPTLAPTTMVRLRSTASTSEAIVDFMNKTDVEVRAIWLDFNGNEIAYTVIGPKARRRYRTYVSHPWIIREVATGARYMLNDRMVVVAHSPEQAVHITAPPKLEYSLSTHQFYPKEFKQAAQALLMCHHHVRHTLHKDVHIDDEPVVCAAPAGPPSSPFAALAKCPPTWGKASMEVDPAATSSSGCSKLGPSLFHVPSTSSLFGSEPSSSLDDGEVTQGVLSSATTQQLSRAASSCMSTSTSYSTLPVTSDQPLPLGPVMRGRTETRAAKLLGWVINKVARVARSPSFSELSYKEMLRGGVRPLQPRDAHSEGVMRHMADLPTHLVLHIIHLMAPENVTQCITRGTAAAHPDIAPAMLVSDPTTWAVHHQPEEVMGPVQ